MPGSPDATTTIDGNYLPPRRRRSAARSASSAKDSKPYWPPKVVPPKGAPNVLLIMTDDAGYGVSGTFGGVIPTPALDRIAKHGAALHAVPLDRALLADAGGADHRPQPPLRRLRRRSPSKSTGFPGYDSVIGVDNATIGEILKENGYATSWFGKKHNTPSFQYSAAGPFDQWPVGMGFDYFYGFMGGETDQWTPYLFRNTTQIFPWVGKPGYNLTTAHGRRRHRAT